MAVLSPGAAMHPFPGGTFTPLAGPSRGTVRTSVWQVSLEPGPMPEPHTVTVEELFVVLEGEATVALGAETFKAATGDAIVVPPDTDCALHNATVGPLRLLAVLPVGGQVRTAEGIFTPPWAE